MTDDERRMLEQIRDAPDDDGPRLVYADWLIERGDPRGEFIAAQLARRSDATRQRWVELLATHREAWTRELAPLRLGSIPFERGFISRVELRSIEEFLAHRRLFVAWIVLPRLRILPGPGPTRFNGGPLQLSARRRFAALHLVGAFGRSVMRRYDVYELAGGTCLLRHDHPARGGMVMAARIDDDPPALVLELEGRKQTVVPLAG